MAILKRRRPYPKDTVYQGYKPYLRQDFHYRCAYCSVHENEWGGPRHFHVEHFKPKSRSQFRRLMLYYGNLLYACDVCNTFKGDDWPGYLDPCKVDYTLHFQVDPKTWEIMGQSRSAKYMVERLHLNRRHLKQLRQQRVTQETIHQQFEQLVSKAFQVIDQQLASNDLGDSAIAAFRFLRIVIEEFHQHHLEWWKRKWEPNIDMADLV